MSSPLPRPPISRKAVASVAFGILGFSVLGGFGCVAAFFLGRAARRDIAHGDVRGAHAATLGYMMGVIGLTIVGAVGALVLGGFVFQRLSG